MIGLSFSLIAIVLVYAAYLLTIYADQLAEQFGLTRSWVGLLVLGLVTSLPELATTLSSVVKVAAPNMALGNISGSIMFNLLILAICDLVYRKGGLLQYMGRKNVVSAYFDIGILLLLLLSLLFPVVLHVGNTVFGLGSILILSVGFFAFWRTFKLEHSSGVVEEAVEEKKKRVGDKYLVLKLLAASGVVVICGYALAVTGDRLAANTGMSHTFVGALFLAVATSLPELIVSFTAIRMGAYELMLGNILGSNIWNVMIVACSDFLYRREALAIPENLGWDQVYTGVFGLFATGVVIFVLRRKKPLKSRWPVGYETIALILLYTLCLTGLYIWGE